MNKLLYLALCVMILVSCDLFNPNNENVGSVTDIDGNEYQTVKIGEQWWMTENLNVTHYRNGDTIAYVNEDQWYGYDNGAYCYYNDNMSNASVYGALYNGLAVMDSRGLAPEGWHIPSDEEWNELQIYLGMRQGQIDSVEYSGNDIGFKLKAVDGWEDYVDSDPEFGGNGSDEVGFAALPGGWRWNYGNGFDIGKEGVFWTSTAYGDNRQWYRSITNGSNAIARDQNFVSFGFSIRCIKD